MRAPFPFFLRIKSLIAEVGDREGISEQTGSGSTEKQEPCFQFSKTKKTLIPKERNPTKLYVLTTT